MKRAIKVLIPILLALAIVVCMGWYLFIYDREFTRDMLLTGARYFEGQGKHAVASWFYDRAYEQAGDNDAVAIELAEQHKAAGNYTKAEATLSQAIEDGGGISLYIALCKTYAQQDKLLDCVRLLDGITNEEIKAQLDGMRPAAPVASPEPGFYNQYISVGVTAESGTLYVSPTAEYPSVKNDPYSAPISLVDGENTLYALAVADNGLVSPLSIFGYTVGGVIEEVHFADAAVEAQVRQQLAIGENQVVFSNALWDIKEFTVPEGAASYDDLKYMIFLEKLTITKGVAGQLSVLSALANLNTLTVTGTSVSAEELAVIGALPKLESLTLSGCGLSTTAGLESAAGLRYLDLSSNTIRNITALSAMHSLQEAYLQNNAMTDLSSLSALTALTRLNLSGNTLTSLAPLGSVSALTWLDASKNQLANISTLGSLAELKELYLSSNQLTDITPLTGCKALRILYIDSNKLTDIAPLGKLSTLANLNFSHNQVKALPTFSKDCALVTINGAHNLLESLDALGGLKSLNNVYMDYNEKISSVKALASCPVLIQVDVYGTAVKDVSMLTSQSIIVNYDPTK